MEVNRSTVAHCGSFHSSAPMSSHDRRSFVEFGIGALVSSAIAPRAAFAASAAAPPADSFPRQDPALVTEMVRVAHSDLERVKRLVEARPALAKAAMDWGFGDWEDALGAASHTGRFEIAEVLLAHGARPTMFSAAMMGQLDVVKAFVASAPGCQGTLGPHGITLLSHAKAGGERARSVFEYLQEIGGADPKPAPRVVLAEADRPKYAGSYVFGPSSNDVLVVANEKNGLSITRPGLPFPRALAAVAPDEFAPAGAEAVRIQFKLRVDGSGELRVLDPDVVVTAIRSAR
jgi:hypothetical protein